MSRSLVVVSLALAALVGCDKKDAASQPPAASASAPAAAASTAPVAEAPAEPSPVPDPIKVAATATAPAEPNAPPPHDEHVQAAAAQIHKGNYKAELDTLEKEDLSADRK